MRKLVILVFVASGLAGCSSTPRKEQSAVPPPPPQAKAGGYYLDDGPGDNPPPDLKSIPDAVPRNEPLNPYANRPYQVAGVSYTPINERKGFSQEGIASWYGRRFHGKKTSSGEIYDMYGMTAAHPTLPIPSYAKVTSLESGKSVIVRVNDRGPFHSGRVIDLSYSAAYKLGIVGKGSARVRVESVGPDTKPIEQEQDVARNTEAAQPSATPDIAAKADYTQGSTIKPGYYVQLGAFGNQENAKKLLSQARAALDIPLELVKVTLVGNLHRVWLGPFANQAEAGDWVRKSHAAMGIGAVTVSR